MLIKRLNNRLFFVFLLLILPSVWALFSPGFYGASDDMHIAWLFEMDRTIKAGQFPPRFVPDLSYGFGYPLFNFVFPLPFYFGEIFHLLGFSFVGSIKLVFGLSVLFSFVFMYLLLKEFVGERLSLLGSIVYVYTPYRATDLYVRGAIGEIVAFVFMPLILLSFIKIVKDERRLLWVGTGSFSLAALVMSHNISAYMLVPFILLFFLLYFILTRRRLLPLLLKVVSTFILALLISAYFWLPAILESKLLKYDTVFNFYDHFPTLKQLLTPYFGYGASVAGPYDGMSFYLGTINIIIFISSLLVFLKFRKKVLALERSVYFWAVGSFVLAIFFMNHRSAFLWSNIPLLPYFQFPWRFLIITTLVTPLLLIPFKYLKWRTLYLILGFVTVVISAGYFKPQDFLGRTDEYFINRYIPYPSPSYEYRQTSEEYLRLPKNTEFRPTDTTIVFNTKEMGNIINVDIINSLDASASVKSEKQFALNYNKYNFPGWRAYIDNQKVEIKTGKPFGQVSIEVPGGTHEVKVVFRETSFRKLLNYISFSTVVIVLFFMFWSLNIKRKK